MPTLPHFQALTAMIETAMQDLAPSMYRELKEVGQLASVVEERARSAEEFYYDEMGRSRSEVHALDLPPQAVVQRMTQARNMAVAFALAQATEFPREECDL